MTADSDVVDVTATTVTAANVIEELGKVVDAIPSALYGKEDLTNLRSTKRSKGLCPRSWWIRNFRSWS
jgi:hypothetical protein